MGHAQHPIWIRTHFTVKSVVNKVEISLPAKKNAEIWATLEEMASMQTSESWRVRKVGWQGSCPSQAIRPPAVGQSIQRRG